MTNEEALSLLSRMDAEQRTLDSLQQARQHVGEVLAKYQEALKALPSLEQARQEHAVAMGSLQEQYHNEETKLVKSREAVKVECEQAIADAKAERVKAAKALKVVQDDLKAKEEFVAKRSKELDAELTAKTKQLEQLQDSMNEFKRKHGLA